MIDFLITFATMSIVMSAVILLLLIFQGQMKKRFTPLSRYIIWAVIILRLCLPMGFGFLPELITVPIIEQPEPLIITEDYQDRVLAELYIDGKTEYITPSVEQYIEEHPELNEKNTGLKIAKKDIPYLVFALWISGASVFMAVTLAVYFKNAVKLNKLIDTPTADLTDIYHSVCREMGIKRKPKIYISSLASSPMVYGFFVTRVVLPNMDMDAESLKNIIRHELVHYKRGDLYLKLGAMVANAFQWFNPLVYIACARLSEEMELSCDSAVLSDIDIVARLDYGNSMLEIAKHCRQAPKLTTGFNPKKKAVKERFENIIDTTKRKRAVVVLILVVTAALVCTAMIGCTVEHKSGIVQDTEAITVEYSEEAKESEEKYENLNEIENQRIDNGQFHVRVDTWHGESEEWTLHYDFDRQTLVFENIDGRHFEYGSASDGVFGISPVYTHTENMSAMAYVTGEEYAMLRYCTEYEGVGSCAWNVLIIDIFTGEVLANATYTPEDILTAHGLSEDVLNSVYLGSNAEGELFPPTIGGYMLDNTEDRYISINLSLDSNIGELLCVAYFDKETQKIDMLTGYNRYVDGEKESEISD